MPKMMMGQIDHARSRVRTIKAELIGESPDSEKTYDTDDLAKAIYHGEVGFSATQLQSFVAKWAEKFLEERSRYNTPSLSKYLLDAAFSPERAAEKARWEAENGVYRARLAVVNAEATQVEDAIVLGDQQAALIALQAFAKFSINL